MSAYLIDHPPRIRQFRDRGTTPSGVVVVHTAESTPDWVGPDAGAEAVASFIAGRTTYGSYHDLCDSDSIVLLVPYSMQAYGGGTGSNPHAYHVSAATQAAKWPTAPKAWREATVVNMAKAAARYARWLQREHGISIPARRITRTQSDNRVPGFISHGDRDPGRRTDPGPAFPWDLFLTTYAAELGESQEDDMADIQVTFPDGKDRPLSKALEHMLKQQDRIDKQLTASANRDRALRARVGEIRAAVDGNATRDEIKQLLNNLDATITIVVNDTEEK